MKNLIVTLLALVGSFAKADIVKINDTFYAVNSANGQISEIKNSGGYAMSPYLKVVKPVIDKSAGH